MEPIKAGGVAMGGGAPLFLIAGPCVIESEEHARRMAEALRSRAAAAGIPLIFKASYDKANRSSGRSFRGPGLKEGLRILAAIRRDFELPVLTDVHSAEEAKAAGESVDVIQIPAFLCRQTDLLQASARTGRVVNVKKGQFMSPWDMRGAVEKIHAAGNERVLLTERGASFGYNNLVVDMRSLPVLREMAATVFDVTHSLQLPGGAGDHSGGMPQFIEVLARAGVAAGVDGIFLEVHDDPAHALSDGANALPLARLDRMLAQLRAIDAAARQATS